MPNYQHNLECEAPICAGDPNPDYKKEVVWFPGELICGKTPYKLFQRRQAKINRYVAKSEFKYPEMYFTAELLEKGARITKGTKGANPETDKVRNTLILKKNCV